MGRKLADARILFVVLVAAAVAFAAVGLPGRGTMARPARPDGISGMGRSVLTIANRDPEQAATVIVDFVNQGTGAKSQYVAPAPLAPGDALDIEASCLGAIPRGAYASTSTSDRSIASQAVTEWPSSGGAAAYEQSRASGEVLVPVVVKESDSHSSLVTIENTDPAQPATVEVSIYASGSTAPTKVVRIPISPGGSQTLDLARDTVNFPPSEIPPGFRGWMRVTSPEPVAVLAMIDAENAMMAVSAFEGVPIEEAATKLFVPRVRRSNDTGTSLALLNPGTSPAAVRADFLGWAGMCVNEAYAVTRTLGAGELVLLGPGTGDGSPLPDDCSAAAVVASDVPVVGVVIDRERPTVDGVPVTREAAHAMSRAEDAAKRTMVPTFRKRAASRSSMLFAMNTGLATATATLALFDERGRPITTCGDACRAEIGPNSTREWLAEEIDAFPDGTDGRAELSSTLPLVVAVGEGGTRSDLTFVRGIPADVPARPLLAQLPLRISYVPLILRGNCAGPTPTPTTGTRPTPSPTPGCTAHDTAMTLTASATTIGVGDNVTVTARLANEGCAQVGLMLYRLQQEARGEIALLDDPEPAPALAPVSPVSVSHPIGLGTGDSDEATFVLRGLRPGTDALSATVSFEVHLGYPGPAYWAGDAAGPVSIRVETRLVPLALPFMARNYAFLIPARE